MSKPPGKSPEAGEITRVDLGDDLLERTASLAGHVRPSPASTTTALMPEAAASPETTPFQDDEYARPVAPDQIPDQFQSARILASEGFTEEAKKILRRIQIADPHYVPAREKLREIHDLELKQIFNEQRKPKRIRRQKAEEDEAALSDLDAERIMRELDRDLRLGIFTDGWDQGEDPERPAFPFLADAESMRAYADALDQELADLSGQDRTDLGIAFLEMGLHELAARQFHAASRVFLHHLEESSEPFLVATGLLAYALILVGRPFDATLMIQSILRDSDIRHENKLEFLYLMGRANETMRKPELALAWYQKVREIDPRYRDVEARIRK